MAEDGVEVDNTPEKEAERDLRSSFVATPDILDRKI